MVSSNTADTVNILCAMFYHAESTRPITSQVNKLLKTKLKSCSTLILCKEDLTLRLLMSYIYGAPSKARNANVVYIWTYVW